MTPDPAPRYFELRDHIDPGQPLNGYTCTVGLPRMRGGRVVIESQPVTLKKAAERDDELPGRVLPGTRLIEATNPALASALAQSGRFEECDPPADLQSRTAGTLKNATGGQKAAKKEG